MRSVEIIKSLPGKGVGEIFGFTDDLAERYVKAGYAKYNDVTADVSHETDAPLPRGRKPAKVDEDDDPDKRYRDRAQSSAKRIRETISDTGGVYIPGE